MSPIAPKTVAEGLAWARLQCAGDDTFMRDAEVLLMHTLQVARSYLFAWPEQRLSSEQQQQFIVNVQRCLQGEPVAYITGHREFWSLDLLVTKDTLIPRPETELLVECVLATFSDHAVRQIADVGTGSGAIALALATERPSWCLHATDNALPALTVAIQNAERLRIRNVEFHLGDWCDALPPLKFDALVSNPPYIAYGDEHISQSVKQYEPHTALFAGEDGLDAICLLIDQAKHYLKSGGYIFLEHGHLQSVMVQSLLEKASYTKINSYQDISGIERVTGAIYEE